MASDENDPYETTKTLWHRGWWDGAWHGWQNLGFPASTEYVSRPECMAWGLVKPDQLHCFVASDDVSTNRIWHKWWANGAWSGWQDLGGPANVSSYLSYDKPSCVAWGLSKPDQLHCFARFDGTLWHRGWWNGAWHPWENLGSQGVWEPGCLAWGLKAPDQLHCFGISNAGGGWWGSMWHIGWWSGAWQAWQNLGHP